MQLNIKGIARDVSHRVGALRELDTLVRAIGECKSKAEEDRIIAAELETLKGRLADPRLDRSRGREYMVRVMYCEMLGHDAAFAYIPCLQFASDANLLTKKAAYLALTQLLHDRHELVLLLVNTLLSDLKSDNFVVVCTALTVVCKLIGPDLVNAVYPLVVQRLSHAKEAVRKKAVMALHHFVRLDPHRTGALAGQDVDKHLRTALCDKDPGVMCAALCALQDVATIDPAPYRSLVPSLTSILKQVAEHRLPKSYDYHRVPAPFIQIKLLRVLAKLCTGDKVASDNAAAVVGAALKRAGGGQTISNAIVYEAVRTITASYPNPALLAAAAEAVTVLLRSPSHNLKYVGLDALAGITRVSPKYALDHQVAVIDCLEDPDDTLRLKTLELLATMTKANNVTVIVERLMLFLKDCSDEHVRRNIATKICTLAERYAPDTRWFISSMAQVFELAGDTLPPGVAHNTMRLIAEQEEDVQGAAVSIFLKLLDRPAGRPLPDVLMHTVCWVLGEYGRLAAQLPPPERASVTQVMNRLCAAVAACQPSPGTRRYLLTALTKLAVANGGKWTPDAEELLAKGKTSTDVELQQRSHEARTLLSVPAMAAAVLPADASCEELEASELGAARSLAFLSAHVDASLAAGAAPYDPPPELADASDLEGLEAAIGDGGAGASGGRAGGGHALRFDAYETAAAPTGGAAAARTAAAAAAAAGGRRNVAEAAAVSDDLLGIGAAAGSLPPVPAAAAAPPPAPSPSAAAASNEPHLTLRAGGPRRWGPTQFAAPGGSSGGGAPTSAAAPQAASPTAVASRAATAAAATVRAASASPSRGQTEKERLAASLFGIAGGAADGGAAAGGVRPASAKGRPAAAALIGDLLGDDDEPTAAAAVGGSGGGGGGGLDLLLDLGDMGAPGGAAGAAAAPAAASLGAAAAAAGPAARPGGLDDLLSGPVSPGGIIMPGTYSAMPGALPGGPVGMLGTAPQPVGVQGMGAAPGAPAAALPPHGGAVAGPPRPLMPGAMAAKGPGGAIGGGRPAGSAPADPFGDLLG